MPDVARVVHDPGMRFVMLIVGSGRSAPRSDGWHAQARSAAEIAGLDATLRAARDGEERLAASLRALARPTPTRDQQIALGHLIAPLQETFAATSAG